MMSDPVPVINRQGAINIMKRISIIVLALLAITAVSAIASSSALALCHLTLGYCVNGTPLGAGESREIDAEVKAGSEFTLKGESLGFKSETKCKKLHLNAAQKPLIIGGMPGTGAKQLIEFEGCSATLGGAACTGGVTVSNAATKTEQVMVDTPTTLKGRLATLFTPAGTVFSTIKFKECGIFGSPSFIVTGSTAALDSPVLVEQPHGLLIWNDTQVIKEVLKLDGTAVKPELKAEGNPATLNGESLVLLVSKQPWGVF
jgi:hypothetical protein